MKWAIKPLGELVTYRKDFITLQPDKLYCRCRVQTFARGIILRDRVTGNEIKTRKQQVCQTGQFLVAEIDAKQGGYGIVPPELNGAIVSSHYFLFTVNQQQLLQKFLGWYLRTADFLQKVKARGSTNYAAIRPNDVLSYTIPLPPLDEQHRIVSKLEALSTKVDEANSLQQEIQTDAQAMLHSVFHRLTESAKYLPMAEVAPVVRRKVEVEIDGEYPELGVRSFGKGTFHKPILNGIDVGTKKLYSINPGDLVFSNVFSWEGAIAVVQPEDEGRVGSHRFITCVPKPSITTADFLRFYLLTEAGIEKVREASPGGAGRNRTLGLKKLEKIEVPVPAYDKQLWFDSLQTKAAAIKQAHSANQTELDALLPSILDKAFKGEL